MRRHPPRLSSPWPAIVDAYNALPEGHPTRRAAVLILTHLSEQGLVTGGMDEAAGRAIRRLMIGPPVSRPTHTDRGCA